MRLFPRQSGRKSSFVPFLKEELNLVETGRGWVGPIICMFIFPLFGNSANIILMALG